nr:MAG TPA: hypothetical protein [Caudoviricetes sp.]
MIVSILLILYMIKHIKMLIVQILQIHLQL